MTVIILHSELSRLRRIIDNIDTTRKKSKFLASLLIHFNCCSCLWLFLLLFGVVVSEVNRKILQLLRIEASLFVFHRLCLYDRRNSLNYSWICFCISLEAERLILMFAFVSKEESKTIENHRRWHLHSTSKLWKPFKDTRQKYRGIRSPSQADDTDAHNDQTNGKRTSADGNDCKNCNRLKN